MNIRNFLTVIVLVLGSTQAWAQTTAFTYQGKLSDGGSPANGNYDLTFQLFDSADIGRGVHQGDTVKLFGVPVSAGIFTVQLDFGACPDCFNGANRFLEIAVKPSGGGSFTTLSPRQPLSSTPYAVRSLSSGTTDLAIDAQQLGGVAADQYVQGSDTRLTDARTPTAGSSNYIQNSTSQQAGTNFNITGNGIAAGTFSASTLNATSQYNFAGQRLLSAEAANQNTFLGLGAGANNTTGKSNSLFGHNAGSLASTGSFNAFFGNRAGLNNTSGGGNNFFGWEAGKANTFGSGNVFVGGQAGLANVGGSNNVAIGDGSGSSVSNGVLNTFLGSGADGTGQINNATAIGANASVARSNALVLGNNVDVGIGTSNPTTIGDRGRVLDVQGKKAVLRLGATEPEGSQWEWQSTTVGPPWIGAFNVGNLTNETNPFTILANGNVGIGNTYPQYKLDVQGDAWVGGSLGVWDTFRAKNILVGFEGGGSLPLCTTSSFVIRTCSSSLRYKTDLHPFTKGLNLINRLHPLTFKWKQDQSLDLGLAAEDVAAVEPLLVTHNEKGEVEGVKYDRLSVVFINAFKQQQTQIERQQAEIAELKRLVCSSRRHARVCK